MIPPIGGCSPPAPSGVGGVFAVDVTVTPGGPEAPRPSADPVAPPEPAAPTLAPGTAAGSGGGSAPAPAGDGYLILANGRRVNIPAGGEVALPAGTRGEVSLFLPGRVPSTIELSGPQAPAVLHPRPDSIPGDAAQATPVSGTVAPGEPGIDVAYHGPVRRSYLGQATGAGGEFRIGVPVTAPEAGLLVARDVNNTPRLAVAALTLNPDQPVTVPPLALASPVGLQPDPPTPPAGTVLSSARLRVRIGTATATALSVRGDQALPAYDLPGCEVALAYEAGSADGQRGTTTMGAPGAVPAFLAPPELAGLPASLAPGARLNWPGVPGAGLYTVWLSDAATPDLPLWEAACLQPALTVPAGLAIAGRALLLQVVAWDAPEVNLYTVASARCLRVPQDLPGLGGRSSRALRRFEP